MIYLLTNKTTGIETITNDKEDVANVLQVTLDFVNTLEAGDVFHILDYRIQVKDSAVDVKQVRNLKLWRN